MQARNKFIASKSAKICRSIYWSNSVYVLSVYFAEECMFYFPIFKILFSHQKYYLRLPVVWMSIGRTNSEVNATAPVFARNSTGGQAKNQYAKCDSQGCSELLFYCP